MFRRSRLCETEKATEDKPLKLIFIEVLAWLRYIKSQYMYAKEGNR